MINISKIPAPRTPVIDGDTNLLTPAWYRYFYNLFIVTGGGGSPTNIEELEYGPPNVTIDEVTQHTVEKFPTSPSDSALLSQIAEIEKQLDGLKMQIQPQLGTMALLQQDNVPWLKFDTTPAGYPTGALGTGALYWDDADRSKTLALVMEDSGDVIQDIGEETFYRVKATSNITKGQVLMFTGTVGSSGGLLAAPATGLTITQSEYILGVATQDITLNSWGYATWFGEIKGVDTTGGVEAWVDGQILYYNPAVAGGLTKTVPTAPNVKVIVAAVVHAAANGILFIRPTFGSSLGDNSNNVEITSAADDDLLQYNSGASRWENVPSTTVQVLSWIEP